MPKKEFLITKEYGINQRLDSFLAVNISELSRSQIQKLIEQQKVKVNKDIKKPSYKLRKGDRVIVEYMDLEPEKIIPKNIPLHCYFYDSHVAVIEKPSGIPVHPGAKQIIHTLVHALLYKLPDLKGVGPEDRPGIVHRLDKDTSGLLVVARTNKAYKELQRQFKKREVEKEYYGLVWGKISKESGQISWAIGRHVKHGERVSVKTKKPREATTLYSVSKRYKDFTLLVIKPVTGRTHQIRVHLAAAGHPIVGDRLYGRRKEDVDCPRMFLHAHRLSFFHPETKEKLEFVSPLPKDLKGYLEKLSE
ncbi:MAG: RluA family pseudouridine synthase [Acidobacteriota bacterium]|nr:RluA family pseudouridine synthase [Acidobacteriota bacterium]